jgi:hypothetical protein
MSHQKPQAGIIHCLLDHSASGETLNFPGSKVLSKLLPQPEAGEVSSAAGTVTEDYI